MSGLLTAEKRARKDLDAKIMKQVDETAFALRLDLVREKKLREEAEERHEKEVADEIIRRIADSVDQERKNRLDGEEAILKRLNDHVYRLIAQEQAARRELEVVGMRQLDEKCLALHVKLAKEKKLREEAEERIARDIQDEINRLSERIDSERRSREVAVCAALVRV